MLAHGREVGRCGARDGRGVKDVAGAQLHALAEADALRPRAQDADREAFDGAAASPELKRLRVGDGASHKAATSDLDLLEPAVKLVGRVRVVCQAEARKEHDVVALLARVDEVLCTHCDRSHVRLISEEEAR